MHKLYKKDNSNNLLYAEFWVKNNSKIILHTGKIGKIGKTTEYTLGEDFADEKEFLDFFESTFKPKGYLDFNENQTFLLAVQFPMKSLAGTKRDHWLKDKVSDYLNDELG